MPKLNQIIAVLSGRKSQSQKDITENTSTVPAERDKGLPNVWLLMAWALALTAVGFYVFVASR